MNDFPLVSIIMPAYNAEKYIREAICSVRAQTYANWELIVVDDGSTDRTPLFVKENCLDDERITYYFQNNKGLGAARNAGFKIASGQWITFLDADDFWMPEKLTIQIQAAADTNADFIFCQGFYLDQNTQQQRPYNSLTGCFTSRQIFPLLLKHNHIPALSVCFKKNLMDDIGLQDTQPIIKGCEDWDYWLRISQSDGYFAGLADRLFNYRVHPESMSSTHRGMAVGVVYVTAKNFKPALLTPADKKEVKIRLLRSYPLVLQNIFKARRITLIVNYLVLLAKILMISYPVIVTVALEFIRKRRKKSTLSL